MATTVSASASLVRHEPHGRRACAWGARLRRCAASGPQRVDSMASSGELVHPLAGRAAARHLDACGSGNPRVPSSWRQSHPGPPTRIRSDAAGWRARPVIGRHQRLDAKLLEHLEYEAPPTSRAEQRLASAARSTTSRPRWSGARYAAAYDRDRRRGERRLGPWRIAQLALADPRWKLGGVVVLVDAAAAYQSKDPRLADTWPAARGSRPRRAEQDRSGDTSLHRHALGHRFAHVVRRLETVDRGLR